MNQSCIDVKEELITNEMKENEFFWNALEYS